MPFVGGSFYLLCCRDACRYPHEGYRVRDTCRSLRAFVRRRNLVCFDAELGLVMPGQDAVIRVCRGAFGGPRGCIRRSKISMMIIRPPQHGQGSR